MGYIKRYEPYLKFPSFQFPIGVASSSSLAVRRIMVKCHSPEILPGFDLFGSWIIFKKFHLASFSKCSGYSNESPNSHDRWSPRSCKVTAVSSNSSDIRWILSPSPPLSKLTTYFLIMLRSHEISRCTKMSLLHFSWNRGTWRNRGAISLYYNSHDSLPSTSDSYPLYGLFFLWQDRTILGRGRHQALASWSAFFPNISNGSRVLPLWWWRQISIVISPYLDVVRVWLEE